MSKYHYKSTKNVNKLTLAFAKAVERHQSDKSDNLVVSPYNALMALAMVAKGADGNTREELAQTLFGVDAQKLDKAIKDLLDLNTAMLAANKGQVELTTANGVWANKEILSLNKTFAAELKKSFAAEVSEEKFSDPSVPGKINAWAGKNTNGLIDKIVEKLDGGDAAMLASALYFKGQWTHKFDKAETEDRAFTSDGSNKLLTPTMKKSYEEGEVWHLAGNDYEAVALTYGEENRKEGKFPTMRIILVRPNDENVTARDWLAQQAGISNPEWLEGYTYFRPAEGEVELPHMDIKQRHSLVEPLKDMGMRDAFISGAADFSPMDANGGKKLFVGSVSHDVVFKTDEEGSEAAAVTSIGMRAESVQFPPPRIDVKFDRSFVFVLQDLATGAVIFAGAVNKPNDDMKPVQKGPSI